MRYLFYLLYLAFVLLTVQALSWLMRSTPAEAMSIAFGVVVMLLAPLAYSEHRHRLHWYEYELLKSLWLFNEERLREITWLAADGADRSDRQGGEELLRRAEQIDRALSLSETGGSDGEYRQRRLLLIELGVKGRGRYPQSALIRDPNAYDFQRRRASLYRFRRALEADPARRAEV